MEIMGNDAKAYVEGIQMAKKKKLNMKICKSIFENI